MSLFDRCWQVPRILRLKDGFSARSLNAKLIIGLIPPVVLILLVTGYISYQVSYHFINVALERTVKLQTRAIAHDIETLLEHARQNLLYIAQSPSETGEIDTFLARNRASGGIDYRSIGFISQKSEEHRFFIAEKDRIAQIPSDWVSGIQPNPLLLLDSLTALRRGEVWISPVMEIELPFPSPDNPNRRVSARVIALATPRTAENGADGYLLLMLNAASIRNVLSLFNSPRSPVWSYARSPEVRYSFFFDKEGWILFQSEDAENPENPLSTYVARSGLEGTLGRPGLSSAFRPAAHYGYFWKMIQEVREGNFGVLKPDEPGDLPFGQKEHYLAYSPIRFQRDSEAGPAVYAGVGYVDISRLTLAAGYKQIDVMFLVTLGAAFLVALIIFLLGRAFTRPILQLAMAVERRKGPESLTPIALPSGGYEVNALKAAINGMIETVRLQMEEIRRKDRAIESAISKEAAWLPGGTGRPKAPPAAKDIPQIVGSGTKLDSLKREIGKAARVDVDVLILGETGTGKQLAAEAVHNLSRRKNGPFISINCGALDENLLLDTLFGHVRGAFTEARADRKGAFLEASGGTLFLDEIQAASGRVQQSMLRVLAVRKVRPLGSDRETDVDVRIITASNADLEALIAENRFREDLYYRLKVLTIRTPPLREHPEDIPALARHFLQEQGRLRGTPVLGLSRGALEKMKLYHWPGNVRELENCIIRASVMAESRIIQAEDLQIGACSTPIDDEPKGPTTRAAGTGRSHIAADGESHRTADEPHPARLNPRQQKGLPWIRRRESVSRSEYQEMVGGDLPARTAVYDLNDLVKKGLLVRTGKGPSTRYRWRTEAGGDAEEKE